MIRTKQRSFNDYYMFQVYKPHALNQIIIKVNFVLLKKNKLNTSLNFYQQEKQSILVLMNQKVINLNSTLMAVSKDNSFK